MHARGSSRPRVATEGPASFCRDTFVALCVSLLNLCGLIWTIELPIVARLLAHVVTPHKYARLKIEIYTFQLNVYALILRVKIILLNSQPFFLLSFFWKILYAQINISDIK